MEEDNLLFELKPKINILNFALSHLTEILVFVFIIVYIGNDPKLLTAAIVTALIIVFGEICLIGIRIHKNRKYFYRFYTDKLVYRDKFFAKDNKEISYEYFKDISYMPTGFVQAKINVGDIRITTYGQGFLKNVIILKNIPEVKENCQRIIDIFKSKE